MVLPSDCPTERVPSGEILTTRPFGSSGPILTWPLSKRTPLASAEASLTHASAVKTEARLRDADAGAVTLSERSDMRTPVSAPSASAPGTPTSVYVWLTAPVMSVHGAAFRCAVTCAALSPTV